ncbi:MAG: PilC/PilY family type IV pilus protein [Pseudomonadota bacterium]|nr:PilC/PilY family type IV pilus protein [Pseudomonadota bacterium]
MASLCLAPGASLAEDIDLFTNPAASATTAPNILIILDNSANWSRNDQAWPTGKQGESELRSLALLMDDPNINEGVNIGLMMFGSGAPDGAYVRYAVRNMTPANKAAFKEMIGTATCPAGNNSLLGTANCILRNFDSPAEKINSASTLYSAAMFEAFKYFGGFTDPARANQDIAGTPQDSTHFGRRRYSVLDSKTDAGAFTDAGKTTYRSPINADGTNACAKNYVVFIANGYPSNDLPISILTGINGDTAVPAGFGNKGWKVANYAKYNNLTDVNELAGRQSIQTYTIDVFNAKPDVANQTALLRAMAKFGGGKYFEAKNEQAILNALRDIIVEIQAVNSVFASASLPINATNRSQNENQVFIGMFRPDPDANPRWYGNLKQYQIALFGDDAKLADKNGAQAIAATTGFVQPCATSFWTTASGTYWSFSAPSAGTCTSIAGSTFSDLPDGSVVEKGGAGEVLRRGNNPAAVAPFTVNRTMYTCAAAPCAAGGFVPFNTASVTAARTTAADATQNTAIVDFTFGKDVNDENGDLNVTEPRPSIHADIAHSRPLPVNFGGTRKVVVYYGSNDGAFRAVEGATGKELWSFVAPEHHAKLKRAYLNTPMVAYPNLPVGIAPLPQRKDYFFDGSSGLYQNADNSRVWIFPTQRRGGRMTYGIDVSAAAPVLKWAKGCPNLANDVDCTAGMTGVGQTWSSPNVAFISGYNSGNDPVLIMGGGYDNCEDVDAAVSTCVTPKGNKVFFLDGNDGSVIRSFDTDRSVAADVTLIDRTFDGNVDHAYVVDTGGNIYRIDMIDPVTLLARAPGAWTMTKIARSNGSNRKFLFGPSALAIGTKVYLALGSGDRERPLITNYPYVSPVTNRFYSFFDDFGTAGLPLNLDDASKLKDVTTGSDCDTILAAGQVGWFMDLNAGRGEQTVTSSVIFGGTVFFSTNRPTPVAPTSCGTNLGEARGYAVNLLNASGVIGTGALCGGTRSGVFIGGGIPPSPVVGTVPVRLPDGTTKSINVLIGGIDLKTGGGSPIGAQQPPIPIAQIRSRVYWYPGGER